MEIATFFCQSVTRKLNEADFKASLACTLIVILMSTLLINSKQFLKL